MQTNPQGDAVTLIPEWVKLIGLPVVGAVVTHLWTKYRTRMSSLRWSVSYQPLAFATEDHGWGKVQILWNDAPSENLHMARVQLQNASSKDLQNLEVHIVVTDNSSSILRSGGQIRGGAQALPFTPAYNEILQKAGKNLLSPADIQYWTRRTPFVIPVLNRGAFADFTVLVSRVDYNTPALGVLGDHLGARLVHEPPAPETLGVREGQAIATGVVVGALGVWLAMRLGLSAGYLALLAWFAGAGAQHLGALVVRAWRGLLAFAD